VKRTLSFLIFWLAVYLPALARAADPFVLIDGDRIVLLGNTLLEREQRYGYWETALVSRHADKNLSFRNLGWSGDTVFGHARAGFGTTADGFRQLKEQVAAARPTVILVGYGANEAFDGEPGLPRFRQGLSVLLDALAQTKARIVLLAPLRQEDLDRPLPEPAAQNKNLRLYRDVLRQAAEKRGYPFVDLYDLLGPDAKVKPDGPLTDNGMHLTVYGYWWSAAALEQGLGLTASNWRVEVEARQKMAQAQGTKVTKEELPWKFQLTDAGLPAPPAPPGSPPKATLPARERVLIVRGLERGTYALHIDGKPVVKAAAEQWAEGVKLMRGPEFDQAEQLREAIVAKNREYFHRWRPQNETYLFGFRKHEQGQNAKEVPQFEPLVAELEKQIAKLRVPLAHTYELVP
jgi:lysophospholipase L1-like esterase